MIALRPALAGVGRVLVAFLVLAAAAASVRAHDIPDEIVLHAFVKPEGERLHFLVRVPLAMLLSMNLPQRGLAYLDLAAVEERLPAAAAATAREIALYENGVALKPSRSAARISLPSDQSFASYEKARASIAGPKLSATTDVVWNQGYLDAHLEYPIGSERSDFSLDMQLAPGLKGRLKLVVRFLPPEGTVRAYQLHGGAGHVMLDPRWYQAAAAFVRFGFRHILDGLDHLLFLLCLVLPFRRVGWTLVAVITSFTAAHSVTLIGAAYGMVPEGRWFPPLVELLIAASIIYMAIENVLRPNLRWRWLVTAAFGLVHGFGFSFMLKNQLQFAGDHLLVSLVAFNIGIELGQLAFIAVALPALTLVLANPRVSERLGMLIVSVFVAHAAWHWLVERWEALSRAKWPEIDPAAAGLWIVLAAALGALAWLALRRAPVLRRSDAEARAELD